MKKLNETLTVFLKAAALLILLPTGYHVTRSVLLHGELFQIDVGVYRLSVDGFPSSLDVDVSQSDRQWMLYDATPR